MSTFAERLKVALEKRKLSQAMAARYCGLTQQSINYIINNNLGSSKLAPRIAAALGINPDWLIYGRGRFEETKVYEIPIFTDPNVLWRFIKNTFDGEDQINYTVTEKYLGSQPFAYLTSPNKLAICGDSEVLVKEQHEYLTLKDSKILITTDKQEISFIIFEWRVRHENF